MGSFEDSRRVCPTPKSSLETPQTQSMWRVGAGKKQQAKKQKIINKQQTKNSTKIYQKITKKLDKINKTKKHKNAPFEVSDLGCVFN